MKNLSLWKIHKKWKKYHCVTTLLDNQKEIKDFVLLFKKFPKNLLELCVCNELNENKISKSKEDKTKWGK